MNRFVFALASITLLLAFALPGNAQKLSPEEQKIVAYVDAHANDAISLLEKVVNIESATQNVSGVKSVGQVFKTEFEAIGLSARWIDMPPEMMRGGHLVAETPGAGGSNGQGKRVLLLGHLDTVLQGEPFRRDGRRAFGTGSSDMKGGDVVLLYALKALADAGALKDTRIIVMLTGDEEAAGRPTEISRADMVAAARRSDLALSFEGAHGKDATVGRRGSSSWTLEVIGSTGHSSQIFKERMGSGAILEASRILDQFYQQFHNDKNLTFNPSLFIGGTEATVNGTGGSATGKTNVVPAKAIVRGDLRFSDEKVKEAARAKMREIVAANLPRTSARITFEDGIPAMPASEGNYALLKQLSQVSQDLGFGPVGSVDPADRGAGDVAYVSHLISGLDGLGADGGGAHAPGEFVQLDSLPMLTKRAAVLIYRLTR